MSQSTFVRVSPFVIHRDPSNLREETHRTNIDAIKTSIVNNLPIPPPKVRSENGVYYCFDGMHRITAYQELNIPVIDVEVYPYEASIAREASFVGNLGRGWSDGELSVYLLEQYQKNISVKDLSIQCGYKTEQPCRDMIKRAFWLHKDLLRMIGKDLTKGSGDEFVRYDIDQQCRIYQELQKNGHKMNDDHIRLWAVYLGFSQIDRDIRSIPKRIISLNSSVQSKPVIIKVDPMIEFVKSIQSQITNFCQQNKCNRSDIIIRL